MLVLSMLVSFLCWVNTRVSRFDLKLSLCRMALEVFRASCEFLSSNKAPRTRLKNAKTRAQDA